MQEFEKRSIRIVKYSKEDMREDNLAEQKTEQQTPPLGLDRWQPGRNQRTLLIRDGGV